MSTADSETVLQEVMDYRRAARQIVRDVTRPVRTRVLALVTLAERARAEAALPEWIQTAIWCETGDGAFIFTGKIPDSPPGPDPVNSTLRALRRKGYSSCRECHRAIPPEDVLQQWDDLAFAALVEHAANERAIPEEASQ